MRNDNTSKPFTDIMYTLVHAKLIAKAHTFYHIKNSK